jgi:large subunit ribosomal protein L6e
VHSETEMARGLADSQGRSKSYHRRGLWAVKAKNGGKFPTHPKQVGPSPSAAEPECKELQLLDGVCC